MRRDALDVLGRAAGGDIEGGDSPHEAVSGIDVEDEDADPAVLDVVADAGRGDVEEPSLGVVATGRRRGDPGKQQQAGDEPHCRVAVHGPVRPPLTVPSIVPPVTRPA